MNLPVEVIDFETYEELIAFVAERECSKNTSVQELSELKRRRLASFRLKLNRMGYALQIKRVSKQFPKGGVRLSFKPFNSIW